MAIRLFTIFQKASKCFFYMFSSVLVQAEASVICHQKRVHARHICPATILTRRLGSAKSSFMEGAKEMKTTSWLKRLARLCATEKAKCTGTGHKFRRVTILLRKHRRFEFDTGLLSTVRSNYRQTPKFPIWMAFPNFSMTHLGHLEAKNKFARTRHSVCLF